MALVKLENVIKEYGVGETRVDAIRGISIDIHEGEFIVILGKSGSGKSTLLSLLGGLEQPTHGDVIFEGEFLGKKSEDQLAMMRRSEIGIIFQHFNLMDSMTALDNVELPLLIAGKSRKERRQWSQELLKIVGLEERMTHYPNELSGGERQRVGIARAFANRAKIILADEPTGDLDSQKGKEIIDLIYDLNQGGSEYEGFDWKPTVVMVTHDVGILRKGMRVLTISDGMIIGDDIFDGEDFRKFDRYGGPSIIIGARYDTEESDQGETLFCSECGAENENAIVGETSCKNCGKLLEGPLK